LTPGITKLIFANPFLKTHTPSLTLKMSFIERTLY
jgi:hypothetical protein